MRLAHLVACLCLLAPSAALAATPFSPDASDLWWNPNESGWGLNLAQQGNLIFATLYVYGGDGRARWFVASDMQATQPSSGRPYNFAGTLYETTGPVFSGPFNPTNVTRRVVGTIAFELTPPNVGRLTYVVDGASVTKSMERQTWRANDPSGSFRVWRMTRPLNCAGVPDTVTQAPMDVTITLTGSSVLINQQNGNPNCAYTGTYLQQGRLGEIVGTYACANATSGVFSVTELEVGVHGFQARYSDTNRGCQIYGHIGGVRTDVLVAP